MAPDSVALPAYIIPIIIGIVVLGVVADSARRKRVAKRLRDEYDSKQR